MYLNKEAKQFLKGKTRTLDHTVGTAKLKNIEQPISPIGTSKQIKVNSVCIFMYINHTFDETIPLKWFFRVLQTAPSSHHLHGGWKNRVHNRVIPYLKLY